jgi:V/A-type H+-transporting ATPase subunit I
MKKVSLIVRERECGTLLEGLRKTGTLHIEKKSVSSEALSGLLNRKALLVRAMSILKRYPVMKNVSKPPVPFGPADIPAFVLRLVGDKRTLQDELAQLVAKRREIEPWGDFDLWSFDFLTRNGIKLFLYELPLPVHKRIGNDIELIVLHRDKRMVKVFSVGVKIPGMIPVAFPAQSLSEVNDQIDGISRRIKGIEHNLGNLAYHKDILEAENNILSERIEFETVRAGMETLENVPAELAVSWISGYIPSDKIDPIKQIATENGWALSWEDPSPRDRPPTYLINKPAVRIIQPLFSMLGTIPGYREYDISLSYMVFLCIFSAMIFGDAIYGFILFITGITIGIVFKKKKGVFPDAAKLVVLLSFCTIVWGCITGSWSGTPVSNLPPVLQLLVIPPFNDSGPLSQFPPFLRKIFNLPELVPVGKLKTQWNIQFLCFTVGMFQLVWARGKNIGKHLPSLSALSEAGWLAVVAGIYFMVLYMLLKVELPSFVPWLIGGGIGCIIVFSEQKSPFDGIGNFLKNIGKSFSNVFSIILKVIGSFADIISYIRLFAVGMAGSIIIQTINSMAIPSEGLGNFGPAFLVRLFSVVLILVFGHTLHILMGTLSVIVHGMRLNLLEYAGNHLGMGWSGYAYNPFAFRQKR